MSNPSNPLTVAQAALQRFTPSNFENVTFHLKQIYQSLNDHNMAIVSLNDRSGEQGQLISNLTSNPTSITIVNNNSGLAGLGRVNVQSADYTLTDDDAGGLVLMQETAPAVVTLPSALITPFYCFIQNDGSDIVTLTPDSGLLINGAATLTVKPAFFVVLFYNNGVSWDAATLPETTLLLETDGTPNSTQTLLNLAAGTNVTLTESAGTVTIDASGGGGGGTKLPHDVTASRSLGGIYQNTTGVDMEISGYCNTSGGGTGAIQAVIGTGTPTDTIWSSAYTATISSGRAGFNFYVPNSYYYTLNTVGGLGSAITGVGLWVEFY
jgi:hypothetical protein